MGETRKDYPRVDSIQYGSGRPEKPISRRNFLKTAAVAAGALAVGRGALKVVESANSAITDPDVWHDLVGRENPHPEYGHLIWSTIITPKLGAKLRSRPASFYHEDAKWPDTRPIDRDPVIRRISETILIENPVILAREPTAGGGRKGVEVKPVDGQPYPIDPGSIWFAISEPFTDSFSFAGVAFLNINDVNFISLGADRKPTVLDKPPFNSILQAPVTGKAPWEGVAKVGGVPLGVGLVSR